MGPTPNASSLVTNLVERPDSKIGLAGPRSDPLCKTLLPPFSSRSAVSSDACSNLGSQFDRLWWGRRRLTGDRGNITRLCVRRRWDGSTVNESNRVSILLLFGGLCRAGLPRGCRRVKNQSGLG